MHATSVCVCFCFVIVEVCGFKGKLRSAQPNKLYIYARKSTFDDQKEFEKLLFFDKGTKRVTKKRERDVVKINPFVNVTLGYCKSLNLQ